MNGREENRWYELESAEKAKTATEEKSDGPKFRLSCVSLAVEAVNKDASANLTDVIPLAQKMYEWVKNG